MYVSLDRATKVRANMETKDQSRHQPGFYGLVVPQKPDFCPDEPSITISAIETIYRSNHDDSETSLSLSDLVNLVLTKAGIEPTDLPLDFREVFDRVTVCGIEINVDWETVYVNQNYEQQMTVYQQAKKEYEDKCDQYLEEMEQTHQQIEHKSRLRDEAEYHRLAQKLGKI